MKDGIVCFCTQKVALGHHPPLPNGGICVLETTLAIELDDGETYAARRTTTGPVTYIRSIPSALGPLAS